MSNTKSIKPVIRKNDTEADKPARKSLTDIYKEKIKLEKKEQKERKIQYEQNREKRILKRKQELENGWKEVLDQRKQVPLIISKHTYSSSHWERMEDIEFLEAIKNENMGDKKIVFIRNIWMYIFPPIQKITVLGPNSSIKNISEFYIITVWPADMPYEDIKNFYNTKYYDYLAVF